MFNWRTEFQDVEQAAKEEEEKDTMKKLENRTEQSKRDLETMDRLEEIRDRACRLAHCMMRSVEAIICGHFGWFFGGWCVMMNMCSCILSQPLFVDIFTINIFATTCLFNWSIIYMLYALSFLLWMSIVYSSMLVVCKIIRFRVDGYSHFYVSPFINIFYCVQSFHILVTFFRCLCFWEHWYLKQSLIVFFPVFCSIYTK